MRFLESVIPGLLAFAGLLLGRTLLLLVWRSLIRALIDMFDPRWLRAQRWLRPAITALVLALHAGWLVA